MEIFTIDQLVTCTLSTADYYDRILVIEETKMCDHKCGDPKCSKQNLKFHNIPYFHHGKYFKTIQISTEKITPYVHKTR